MTMFICEALWVCLVYEKCYINQVALPCLLVLNTCCLPGVNVTPWKRVALLTYDFLLLELCQAFPTGEQMQLHLQIIVALYSIWARRTLIALNNIISTHCLLQTLIALSNIIRSTFWSYRASINCYFFFFFSVQLRRRSTPLVSEAFVSFFVEMVVHSSTHVKHGNSRPGIFKRKAFCKSIENKSQQQFDSDFIATKMFDVFIWR